MGGDVGTGFKLCVIKLKSADPRQLLHTRQITTAYRTGIVTLPDPDLLLALSQEERRVHFTVLST